MRKQKHEPERAQGFTEENVERGFLLTVMRQIPKFVVLQLLRGYKWAISPMFPPACRFVPTCSEYATEAVERYGAVRGGGMALMRLMRCHPLAHGGFDPVVKQQPKLHPSTGSGQAFSQSTREMGHPACERQPTSPSPMRGAI